MLGRLRERNAADDEKYRSSLIEVMTDGLFASEWRTIINEIMKKELLTIKNSGFYVDIDSNDIMLSEPSSAASKTGGASPRASIATLKASWPQSLSPRSSSGGYNESEP